MNIEHLIVRKKETNSQSAGEKKTYTTYTIIRAKTEHIFVSFLPAVSFCCVTHFQKNNSVAIWQREQYVCSCLPYIRS